jgi:hypothetical protein
MANVKTSQKSVQSQTGDETNNAAAAAKNATASTKTPQENPPQGGGDAPKPKNTGVDKTEQKTTTGTEGRVEKAPKWIDEAKKIFKKHPSDILYFTSDGFGFLQEQEATYHAATLKDKEITVINKKDAE